MNLLARRRTYRDAGKHRRMDHRARRRARAIPIVDARTLQAHYVTDEAVAVGRRPKGRYVALCGLVVLPASLTVGERGVCSGCVAS